MDHRLPCSKGGSGAIVLPLDMNIEPQHRVVDKWAALARKQPRSSLLYAWKRVFIGRQREPWLQTQRMLMERTSSLVGSVCGQWLHISTRFARRSSMA